MIDPGAPRSRGSRDCNTIEFVGVGDSTANGNSPLVLGVCGHMDLDPGDVPELRNAVAAFLRQLKEHLPETEILEEVAGCGLGHGKGRCLSHPA